MKNQAKETAMYYIYGLLLGCTKADEDSPEYHDMKAALEDLDSLIENVFEMVSRNGGDASMSDIVRYCTRYQEEALSYI